MAHPHGSPVGPVWTDSLRVISEAGLATAAWLVLVRFGRDLSPAELEQRRQRVMLQLFTMAKRGLVRLVRPGARGRVWAIDDGGRMALARAAEPKPTKPSRVLKTHAWRRLKTAERRVAARAIGHCINENASLTHGPATHGVRCEACRRTHRGEGKTRSKR